ncbi:MAG: choline dehydrogenase [Acidiferrobacterales bacterium]|nr:choline dehydrogenase [Acidiferrobacterales bacterium]
MKFDYIIVGAGSAGSVLAERLSRDGQSSVLLLEAGGDNETLSLRMPAAVLAHLNSTKHNWAFQGEPEPELNGRRLQHDRGKTLGGSSSINGMIFIRGHARDYDGWQKSGCEGWGYAHVLPYFKRMENYSHGEDDFRGGSGPLHVQRSAPDNPLVHAFLKSGEQAGYPGTDDINGYVQEGFGLLDSSIYRGERWSVVRAYLDRARPRTNLEIQTNAHVQKIVIDDGRADGVTYHQGGRSATVRARREVILCAGAVGTPQILMVSGVGPADHLQELGIEVLHHLPGVGQNLNDHPDFVMQYECLKPVTLWPKTRPVGRIAAGIRWLVTRRGTCASNQFEAVACIRSDCGVDYPDLQLTITPVAVDNQTWNVLPSHAFQIHVGLMRAFSRGRIELRSADPADSPRIAANYMNDSRDREVLRKGIRLVRELIRQPAFNELCGEEIFPGSRAESQSELDAVISSHCNTQWHLSGTARMGTDGGAVVDGQGRVHGLQGLRVVDASIMPRVTNGNTNGPTIMIAEKLGDAIVGIEPLPVIETEVWHNPDYMNCQR